MAGFTKGEQNAAALGGKFVIGELSAGSAAFGTAATTDTFIPLADDDGLFFVADWVIVQSSVQANGVLSVTGINGTDGTVTVTRATSTGADTYYWIAGNLS